MSEPFPKTSGHLSRSDQRAHQNDCDAWRSEQQQRIRDSQEQMQARGMEHRWRVYYVVLWPRFYEGWTDTSAESKDEAREKIATYLNRICTLPSDWKFADREPELIA